MYIQNINSCINETIDTNVCTPNTMWEIIKGNIRNYSIKYATHKKKEQSRRENTILNQIQTLEQTISRNLTPNENDINSLNNLKQELDHITTVKINGFILRAKATHIENNEKNSKYFANLEKRHWEQKIIHKLTINNKEVTDANEILHEQKEFYEKLYKKRNTSDIDLDFFDGNLPTLNDEDKNYCEGLLTEQECKEALFDMKNEKSPGSDGLTVEFYKTFWGILKSHFIKSINYSFEHGSLTVLQRQGLVSLIPKSGNKLDVLSNWRPISLLNIDYKIASKTISNRIKKVLPTIINPCQTGFIKGRYIGENIRLIQECIEYLNNTNKPGLLFFADFEKAFDSINHDFMFKCLENFNFGHSFIQWVKLFYRDINSKIINNGNLSDSFPVERGVRQGCPLSSYLFLCCIEILSNCITKNSDIQGIIIESKEIKQSMFADDATYLTNGSENSFMSLMKTLTKFGDISGLKLNTAKSTILRVGSLKQSDLEYNKCKRFIWTSKSAKTLGITFSNDITINLEKNILPKLQEFKNVLKQWHHRKLTLLGKVTVLKTFALPKLIYPLSVLENPPNYILDDINKTIFEYLWDKKPDKIKRKNVILSIENGGITIPNIYYLINSLKAGWVKRYLDVKNKGLWKMFYKRILHKYGDHLIFECKLTEADIHKMYKENMFLKDILISWQKIQIGLPKNNIKKEIIWNNTEIKCNGETFFYKDWYEKGIKFLEHFFDFRINNYYDFETFRYMFNLRSNDFLKYYNIIGNIPIIMENAIKTETSINVENEQLINKIVEIKKVNKYLYKIQIPQRTFLTKYEEKWERSLNVKIDWKSHYVIPFKSTTDTSLRSFQYKFLTQILPTNKDLHNYKYKPSSLCDFCSSYVETIEHLFWECRYVQIIWNELIAFLNTKNINITINLIDVCLGTFKGGVDNITVNYIIILMKHYIFRTKQTNNIPAFNSFINHLNSRIKVEQEIALLKDRSELHNRKWIKFTNL